MSVRLLALCACVGASMVVVGCGGDEETVRVPDRVSGEIEVSIEASGDAGVAGVIATLEQAGVRRTRVTLDGLDQGDVGYVPGKNVVHLHEGSCSDIGQGRTWRLKAPSGGTSTTVVDVELGILVATPHAIEVHLAPTGAGMDDGESAGAGATGATSELDPLACGVVPGPA